MAVHIRKQDRSVEAALRRIAGLLIGEAIAAIDDMDKPTDRTIHEVRQATKKLRALVRLVRPVFTRFAPMNATLRDLAHSLSGARDAQVMAETLDRLIEDEGLAGIDVGAVHAGLAGAGPAAPEVALAQARKTLVALRATARRWAIGADGWAAIEGGLTATYRKARRAMHAAERHGDAEASHEWRQHVKYHAQHMRLIEAMAPETLHDRAHRLNKLSELLGRRHDLDLLVATLAAHPERFGGLMATAPLGEAARHRMRRLDKRARKLGEALFEEKPGQIVRHWRAEWRDWRGKAALAEAMA